MDGCLNGGVRQKKACFYLIKEEAVCLGWRDWRPGTILYDRVWH